MVSTIALATVPVFVVFVVGYGLIKRVNVYDEFIAGAKKGLGTAFRIMPYVIGMIFAIDIFKASGCFEYISNCIGPYMQNVGVPPEIIPLALMRPFSGGASVGILAGMLGAYGPDSYIGRVSSTMMGSSETLFYTVSLYCGSVGVTRTRYIIPVGLMTDVFGVIASCMICKIAF